MADETRDPAGDQAAPEEEMPRRTGRRAQPAAARGDPPRGGGLPPHIVSAVVSAVVLVLFAPGLFVAGYFTNAAVGDNGGGTPVAALPTAQPTTTAQATATPPIVVANVSVDDDPSWGPADAPVTMIEFSDFQCPYCARFVTETLPQIKQAYEGKIRFVFRDYPLSQLHANAEKAAEAAGCANEQGKFWEYHDKLFSNQSALDVASLKSYASQLGLDSGTFDQCLDSSKYAQEIQKDIQDGDSYGVQGTPAFFVNGQLVEGALPFADYADSSGKQQDGFNSIIAKALQ
jgi:protein-disulfide isomerase